jgi:hypothetical protein
VRLQVNTTIRELGGGRIEALVGRYIVLLGRPWRQERVARFQFHPSLTAVLREPPQELSRAELLRRLAGAGLDEERAQACLERLLERGLLWPVAVVDGLDPNPDWGRLAGSGTVVEAAAGMHAAVRALAEAGWRERGALGRRIRGMEGEALASVGSAGDERHRNAVLEDSCLCGGGEAIGGALPGLVAEVGAFLRTEVSLRPEFVRLRDAFVQAYGEGGSCSDVVGFLMRAGGRLVPPSEPGLAASPSGPVELIAAEEGARIGLTAFLQVVPGDEASPVGGDASLVVNRVYEGVGWLSARFAAGRHPDQEALRTRLRGWLGQALAPREPVDLMVGGECNDLQAHPRLTRRVFAWPGEPFLASRTRLLRAADVVLRHDPASGSLDVLDADGRAVALVYLGSVLPSPSWGIPYALTVLAQPYLIRRPGAALRDGSPGNVRHQPRYTVGRLILTRAAWWVRASWMRETWFARSGARRLLDVARECDAQGIPPSFFARGHRPLRPGELDGGLDARKPMWVDVRNPFCLDLLERTAAAAEWVVLTEALPGPEHPWATMHGEGHVSEIQVEMVLSAAGERRGT